MNWQLVNNICWLLWMAAWAYDRFIGEPKRLKSWRKETILLSVKYLSEAGYQVTKAVPFKDYN